MQSDRLKRLFEFGLATDILLRGAGDGFPACYVKREVYTLFSCCERRKTCYFADSLVGCNDQVSYRHRSNRRSRIKVVVSGLAVFENNGGESRLKISR